MYVRTHARTHARTHTHTHTHDMDQLLYYHLFQDDIFVQTRVFWLSKTTPHLYRQNHSQHQDKHEDITTWLSRRIRIT